MWCAPFSVRPPEEDRGRPGDPDRPPFLVMLFLATKQALANAWAVITCKAKKEIKAHTAPLEERMKMARMANLTEFQVEHLLKDPNPMVRMELVHNDTISGDTLERLKSDPDVTVSTIARRKQMQLIGIL